MVFTPTTAQMGHVSNFGTSDSGAIDEEFYFESCDFGKNGTVMERDGMRGTRSLSADDIKEGIFTCDGPVSLVPTPEDLDIWLPRILGASEAATDIFALAETLPEFNVGVDRGGDAYTYDGVKVNKATFRCSKGEPLRLLLDLIGKTETTGQTFPTLTLSNAGFYAMHELVLTIESVEREVAEIEIVIDNQLVGDRHNNSQSVTDIPSGGRLITMKVVMPFSGANVALHNAAVTGAAGTAAWSFGGYSTSFAFAALQAPKQTPPVRGKTEETMLTKNFTARATAATKELIVTHDAAA